MVTVFDPTISGIEADHCVVPVAVPEYPILVDQDTLATPVLSDAVPAKVIDACKDETEVCDGLVMVSVGGVVSFAGPEAPPPDFVGVVVGVVGTGTVAVGIVG